jgi:anti-sigma-K factor RsiG
LTVTSTERRSLEPLPDLGSLSDHDLKQEIDKLKEQEREISYQRRILHGKIDILRAELVARLQKDGGKGVLENVDVDSLTAILSGKSAPNIEGNESTG